MATTATLTASNNLLGMFVLGGEDGATETHEQLGSLLLEGEIVEFATGGEKGGALFTSHRIIIASDAGLFNKRSVVTMLRRAAIDAVAIDHTNNLTVQCAGRGFGSVYLSFDGEVAPDKLARWFGAGMAEADHR